MMSENQYDAIFTTDLATIGIRCDGSYLVKLAYLKRKKNKSSKIKAVQRIQAKIEKYLNPVSNTKALKINTRLNVSLFQESVLRQLMLIPYGEIRTYGEIAKILKTSPRAVGNACRNNPVPIIIPCHRVVAASGVGGYDGATEGDTLDIKIHLLQLEGAVLQQPV
jgi:methylated-DNA-[protein]-cysteine S-methyltransferase